MKFLKLFQGRASEPVSEAQRLSAYRLSGDIGVLGTLYEPYMEMIFAICYQYLRDEDESKDAVMQIFEKLIKDLRTHEVANFKSWVYTVARNHCLMQIRAAKVFIPTEEMKEMEEEKDLYQETWEQALFSDNRLTALEKCIEALGSEQRLSIELFYKQQKCYQEISTMTGFDPGRVKSYIQNGKRNLKICIEKNGRY